MLSCSIWFSAPRLVCTVCTARMVPCTIRAVHTSYAAALKTTIHSKTRRRKPYAATQHLMLLMMGVCTRNMSSYEYINKITYLHQVGISLYFIKNKFENTYIVFRSVNANVYT